MKKLFHQLQSSVASFDPPLDPKLRTGVKKSEVRAVEKSLGVKFPSDLVLWYTFANGQTTNCIAEGDVIIPRFRYGKKPDERSGEGWFADLGDLVYQTQLFRERVQEYGLRRDKCFGPVTNHDQMIIFTVGETPWWLAVDLKPMHGGCVGQVVSINDYPEHTVVLASSFAKFLQRIIDGYASNTYAYDPVYLSEP